jgi:hypothetical protein
VRTRARTIAALRRSIEVLEALREVDLGIAWAHPEDAAVAFADIAKAERAIAQAEERIAQLEASERLTLDPPETPG